MSYGIPYMGSKSKICRDICGIFPPADNFYDLFGGGFSVTHFMLKYRAKDFKQFHFNEIRPGVCDLIKDSMAGKYSYDKFSPPWISREEFFERKEIDAYVKLIWSFGNNGECYLFGKDIELTKRSMHMAVVFNEFDAYAIKIFGMNKFKEGYSITDKRLFLKNRVALLGKGIDLQQLEQLERLQQLKQLNQLEQLEQLERLEQLNQLQQLQQPSPLNFYNQSYENVKIKENSVVYCDIPYKGTGGYGGIFNHEKFMNWAATMPSPVFISEYDVPDKRFKLIKSVKKRSMLRVKKAGPRVVKDENIYVNQAGYEKLTRKT